MPQSVSKRAQKAEMKALIKLMEFFTMRNRVLTKREKRRKDRANRACFFCHKQGHIARFCPKRLKRYEWLSMEFA